MALQGGNLLLSRRQVTLAAGTTTIDTGIRVSSNNFSPDPNAPSRLMIVPMPPMANWTNVAAFSEPYLLNGTVHVDFAASADAAVNVMFWLPHSLIGPVSAENYASNTNIITSVGEACTVSFQGV